MPVLDFEIGGTRLLSGGRINDRYWGRQQRKGWAAVLDV